VKPISAVQQNRKSASIHQNSVARLITTALGILSLGSIILIHWLDLPGKLAEVPYLGYAYIALMIGSALSAILILQNDKRGWWLGGALALGAIVAYALNRTVALPLAMNDIGNRSEPLGVYSLVAEGAMVAVSGWVLSQKALDQKVQSGLESFKAEEW
jgi:hypothetical protein